MRILLVSDTYLPTISGVTTVVSEYKKKLEQKGHVVGILVPKIKHNRESIKNLFAVSGIPSILRSDTIIPIIPHKLEEKISKFKPEVIHIHSPGILGIWARYFAKKHKIKLVTTIHGIPNFSTTYLPFGHLYQKVIEKKGWKFWKWFLKPSNVIIAPSIFIINELKKQNFKQKILHLPFWVEPYYFKKNKQKKSLDGKLPTIFLFFGRLDNDKNLPFLIKAWSKTQTKNKQLIIAGRNLKNQKEDLIAQTKNLNCSNSVTIYGKVSEKKKEELFSQSSFFVMPSKVEVQSIVTCQAALSGIPVIVAKSGALTEIVKNSSHPSLTFNPDSLKSLTNLIDDCQINKNKYTKSYQLNKNFSKFFQKKYLLETLISVAYKIK